MAVPIGSIDLRRGRNGYLPPWAIADDECADAVNVDWYGSNFARRRNGVSTVSTTFSAGGPFGGIISSLFRHVPGTDESLAELWAVDSTGVVGRMAGASTFSAPTLKDALTGNGWDVSGASVNGKFALGYKSAQNRLHVWDTSTVRRAGIDPGSTAPTVADGGGGGAYAAVLRYYRVRFTEQSGGVTVRRSEPTPSRSFTPDGAHANATITRPTAPGEGETHWELEISADNVTFYVVLGDGGLAGATVIATTTGTDASAFAIYSANGAVSKLTGTYTLWPSVKFVAAYENRLLGFGSHTSTEKQNRIWFSPPIGALNVGDAERLDTTTGYYKDLDEHDSGSPKGLIGPAFGNMYAFKSTQVWELSPTGSPDAPFSARAISKRVGAVGPNAMDVGEDAQGNPAIYWWSRRGPYRYGVGGVEFIGRSQRDVILGPTVTWFPDATSVQAVVRFYPERGQVWFWYSSGGNDPNELLIYTIETGAWSRCPSGAGNLSKARCAVLFSTTTGASMSTDMKPYLGSTLTSNLLGKADTGSQDLQTANFQAYVITKAYQPGGPFRRATISDVWLTYTKPANNATLTWVTIGDHGASQKSGTVVLSASADSAHQGVRIDNSAIGGVQYVQYEIGDGSAQDATWTLEALAAQATPQEWVTE
jgi:hypothetical protein